MFVFRLGAYALAIASFFIVVIDGAQSIAAKELVLTSVAVIADAFFPRWPEASTVFVGGQSLPGLWDFTKEYAIAVPASVAVLSVALILISVDSVISATFAQVRRSMRRL